MKWDIMDIALPWRYFIVECLRNGELPLWNPYIHLGFPQMGDPSTWYPVTWFLALFGPYTVFDVQLEYLLHLFIAAVGFFKLSIVYLERTYPSTNSNRLIAVFSAAFYACSGFMVGNAQHLGWIISAAWIPFAIYYLERLLYEKRVINILGLSLTMYMLLSGGYPGMFISTAYLLAGLFLGHLILHQKEGKNSQKLQKVMIPALLFVLISAVVLVSSFELQPLINRGVALHNDNSSNGILSGSFPMVGLYSFLFPFVSTLKNAGWGGETTLMNAYFGIFPFLLLIALPFVKKQALRLYLFTGVGIFFMMMAMGDTFPLRSLFYYLLPFMDVFRFPSFFRLFAILFFLLASALMARAFLDNKKNMKFLIKYLAALTTIGIVILVYVFFQMEKWPFKELLVQGEGMTRFKEVSTLSERIFFQLALILSFLVASIYAIFRSKPILFCAILILEIFSFTQLNMFNTIVDKSAPKETELALAKLPEGFPAPNLVDPVSAFDDKQQNNIPYLWKNMNSYHKNISADGASPYGLNSMQESVNQGMIEKAIQYPAVFSASLKAEGEDNIIVGRNTDVDLRITEYSPNEIQIESNYSTAHTLVYMQNVHPNWVLTVDNERAEIVVVNKTLVGVNLPSGNHLVRLSFEASHSIAAFFLSSFVFVAAFFSLIVLKIKE